MAEMELTTKDRTKWLQNTLIFFAPLFILYLVFVQGQITENGFDVTDFVPTREVVGAIMLYTINTLIDLLRKFLANGQ